VHSATYIWSEIPANRRAHRRGKDLDMFASIARLFHAWKRHEVVTRELSNLSDRELADIGITRSDIDRIASDHAHR